MNQMAYDRNHRALMRLLALLFVSIGLADDTSEALRLTDRSARALRALGDPATISRRLHRIIYKLLQPVESATRRLIVVLAGTLPMPKLKPSEIAPRPAPANPSADAPASGPEAETGHAATGAPCFPLLEALRTKFHQYDAEMVLPPFDRSVFDTDPAKAYEQVPDAGLMRRIAALTIALEDMPAQARRLVRWRAFRDAAYAQRDQPGSAFRPRRWSTLRPGGGPGAPAPSVPKSRWREEHHVLAETQSMAWYAVTYPDTS